MSKLNNRMLFFRGLFIAFNSLLLLFGSRLLDLDNFSDFVLFKSVIGMATLADLGAYQLILHDLTKVKERNPLFKFSPASIGFIPHIITSRIIFIGIVLVLYSLVFSKFSDAELSLSHLLMLFICLSLVTMTYYLECVMESLSLIIIALEARTISSFIMLFTTLYFMNIGCGSDSIIYGIMLSYTVNIAWLYRKINIKLNLELFKFQHPSHMSIIDSLRKYYDTNYAIASIVGGFGMMALIPISALFLVKSELATFGLIFTLSMGVLGLTSVVSNHSFIIYKNLILEKNIDLLEKILIKNIIYTTLIQFFCFIIIGTSLFFGLFGKPGQDADLFTMGSMIIAVVMINISAHINTIFKTIGIEINSFISVIATLICIFLLACLGGIYGQIGAGLSFVAYAFIIFTNSILRYISIRIVL